MPNYARFDGLDDFETYYREEIAPALRTDPDVDTDPDCETPTYTWLKGNFSGFVERLRRDHDLSPGDFYDAVGLPPNSDDMDDAWGISHEPTIRGLEDYLEELDRDRGRAETTVGPRRSRLKTYVTLTRRSTRPATSSRRYWTRPRSRTKSRASETHSAASTRS
jgi:hypothetical protein